MKISMEHCMHKILPIIAHAKSAHTLVDCPVELPLFSLKTDPA